MFSSRVQFLEQKKSSPFGRVDFEGLGHSAQAHCEIFQRVEHPHGLVFEVDDLCPVQTNFRCRFVGGNQILQYELTVISGIFKKYSIVTSFEKNYPDALCATATTPL